MEVVVESEGVVHGEVKGAVKGVKGTWSVEHPISWMLTVTVMCSTNVVVDGGREIGDGRCYEVWRKLL